MTATPLCKYPQPLVLSRGLGSRATCCPEHWWARIVRDRSGWHIVSDPEPVKAVSR